MVRKFAVIFREGGRMDEETQREIQDFAFFMTEEDELQKRRRRGEIPPPSGCCGCTLPVLVLLLAGLVLLL